MAMKPAIDTNRHATTTARARRQPSPASHEREKVRLIDGWEQYKTLWDGLEFKRQLINMGDKTVRAVWCEAAPERSTH